MKELLAEIRMSVMKNRRRLFLTGTAIAWSMFILIVLLGSAEGLKRGVVSSFHLDMPQLTSVVSGERSVPYGGHSRDSRVELFSEDAEALAAGGIRNLDAVFPVIYIPGTVVRGACHSDIMLTGCTPGYIDAIYEQVRRGRGIDGPDISGKRNVVVMNARLAARMFGDVDPIGAIVEFSGIAYTVVGVCESRFVEDTSPMCFCPLSAALDHFRPRGNLDCIFVKDSGIRDNGRNVAFMNDIRNFLSLRKGFAATDNKALRVSNSNEYFILGHNVLDSLSAFIWLLGLATLFAGVVGVGNIMLVAVKERTSEFGIRLAMGATDREIIRLVVLESLILVLAFGYIGIMAGVGLLRIAAAVSGDAVGMFRDPSVDFLAVVAANVVLVVSGVLAGYLPARKAVRLKLVDALK